MKVVKMSDYMKPANPGESAKSIDSIIENNKVRGTDPTETLVWILSYAYSRLIFHQQDINSAINIMDEIMSCYADPEVFEDLYQAPPDFDD